MIKHFYFGVISPEEVESYGPEFTPFEVDNIYCEFCIELDLSNGHMRIMDSIGRMVPIDRAHYAGLLGAVTAAEEMQYVAEEIEEDLIALNEIVGLIIPN